MISGWLARARSHALRSIASRPRPGEDGQLAIVIPLALIISVAGTLMWGYIQVLYAQSSTNILRSDSAMIAKTISTRVLDQLKGPYIPCKEPFHDKFPGE